MPETGAVARKGRIVHEYACTQHLLRWGIITEALTVFNKQQARAVKREIDRVLWEVWDPIGVRDLGGPADEYSGYVNGVYELLTSGASENKVAEHLLCIVTERMEISRATLAAMQPAVKALRAIPLLSDSSR